jgi:RIO kinase 1
MRVPEALEPLIDQGVLDEVVRPLMSGKEAQVYLVVARGQRCVAKVYKDATHRSFKNRADYTEGRKVRGSREQRAMDKGSKYGREQEEEAWRNKEVDCIYRLRGAGVAVPEPLAFEEGVLVMELVADAGGEPAPRLVDVELRAEEAERVFNFLLREVVKMLCAGVVHGDLSDFNVLMSARGPVIIDFPQVVDPAVNLSARKLLIRDVDNLTRFFCRWAPHLQRTRYGQEMWALYEKGDLQPDTPLTGRFKDSEKRANVSSLLAEIEALERESRERRAALGLPPPRPARAPVQLEPAPRGGKPDRGPRPPKGERGGDDRGPRPDKAGRPPRPERAEGPGPAPAWQERGARPHDEISGGDGQVREPRGERGPRPERREDRGPRPERGGFEDRGPRPERGGFEDRGPRPDQRGFEDRGPRPDRAAFEDRGPRPPRGGFEDRGPQPERHGDRAPRPERREERGPRPDRAGVEDRGPRPVGRDDRGPRPPRGGFEDRGPRPPRGGFEDRGPRPPRGGFEDRGPRPPRGAGRRRDEDDEG